MAEPCVFCDLSKIKSEIETYTVQFERFHVFKPLRPVTRGHRLVIPERHLVNALENPVTTGRAAAVAADWAASYPNADGFNIITSVGPAATQSVSHLHWHIVPRRVGDGLPLPWTPQQKEHDEMALRKHGEGEVLPSAEQQKTAAQKAGLSKEAAEELRQENESADGAHGG